IEFILYYPRDEKIEKYIFRYLNLKEKSHIKEDSLIFLELKNSEFIKSKDLREYLNEKSKNLKEDPKKNIEEGFDFATDLFRVEDHTGLLARKVDKDEYFMQKIGINKKNITNIRVDNKIKRVDEVEKEILNDLKKYVNREKKEEEVIQLKRTEMTIKKSISMLDDDSVEKLSFDIAIMLNFMEMYDTALEFIDDIEEKYLPDKEIAERLNFEYLRVMTLMEMKNFYDAVLTVDRIISSFPLLQREKVCFMYLKAESLKYVNDLKGAMSIYDWINKIIPNYRQVRKRIGQLE
ncbi:MAG: hypothetical protein OXB84_02300, partial [Halobacteriovoraceae bacterium]|nr:hypothetical protein [Halobacteriovoraceae bacterium]